MRDPGKDISKGFGFRGFYWGKIESVERTARQVEIEWVTEPVKGELVCETSFGIGVDPT